MTIKNKNDISGKIITYVQDTSRTYDDILLLQLRSYNLSVTGKKEQDKKFIYVVKDDVLLGALTVSYMWDWATVGNVFYENIDVLKELLIKAWDLFKEKAVGIKFFSPVKKRFEDFVSAGFVHTSTLKTSKLFDYYYADLMELNETSSNKYQIIVTEEEHPTYKVVLSQQMDAFCKQHQLNGKLEEVQFVALDQEKFVGGVTGELYEDTMYISYLVVDEQYRSHHIGSKLMRLIEDYAKEKGLNVLELGTCEFQAKGFYEKNGYQVVYTRNDNPRGYKNYTMVKNI